MAEARQRAAQHVGEKMVRSSLDKMVAMMPAALPKGIRSLGPAPGRVNEWHCVIDGPSNSVYDGGSFEATFKFKAPYPMVPPQITFRTPVYHPQIDKSGNVGLAILHGAWKPWIQPIHIAQALRLLLARPGDTRLVRVEGKSKHWQAVSPPCCEQFRDDRARFDEIACMWTQRYASASRMAYVPTLFELTACQLGSGGRGSGGAPPGSQALAMIPDLLWRPINDAREEMGCSRLPEPVHCRR